MSRKSKRSVKQQIGARCLNLVKQFFPKVSKVKDADDSLIIEVTAADVKSSQVRNHNACAMAVACKRSQRLDGVIISVGTAYLIKNEEATRYILPSSVSREVVSFDRNGSFMPGEYHISPFPKSNRIGAQRNYTDPASAEGSRGSKS